MERAELASRFIEATDAERERLFQTHQIVVDAELAYAVKDICLEAWSSDPTRTKRAAQTLEFLANRNNSGEIVACADWCSGIAALVDARMENAIGHLNDANLRFIQLGLPQIAVATQVSKLLALATIGRYDEAIECGLGALKILEKNGDILTSGKIEHNIGNIYWRRDRYGEAEEFFRAARARFEALKDDRQLATLDNCLGYIQSLKHDFKSAEMFYEQALNRAQAAGLVATQAGIESSIGNLALFQGRYDRALDFLERARRRYSEMGMRHESAISELEIANTYLELNLVAEATEFYDRVIPVFAELSMNAEQALAFSQYGRAAILLGEFGKAEELLREARVLYNKETNALGEAMVTLTIAQLYYTAGDFQKAIDAATQAEPALSNAAVWRHVLVARWIRGDSTRALGSLNDARLILESTLADSIAQEQPQIEQRCHTSLGLVSMGEGDTDIAEDAFGRSIQLIESLRAPLPAEEFRAAFFSDKLVPYEEMIRICLTDPKSNRTKEAFEYAERARSRALAEMTAGPQPVVPQAHDSFEVDLFAQLETLRCELNWLYSQINRPIQKQDAAEHAEQMISHQNGVREREKKIVEITRQLQHRVNARTHHTDASDLDLKRLQERIGEDTMIVEYGNLDGNFFAFVVTNDDIEVIRNLGSESEVEAQLEQLRFQIDTLRFGAVRMRKHLPSLTTRAQVHLQKLYDLLLAPIAENFEGRRLIIVPHRALYYLPFQALYDGSKYLIERHEVSYAPSAAILRHCLDRPQRPLRRALLVGVADEQTPLVRAEVRALEPLFASSTVLLDEAATLTSIRNHVPDSDVLHLACHGQFRPDNPRFSSLRLAQDWMTMRDAAELDLSHCGIVSLSACETGVNAVTPGNELIGLARGFFSAGAPTILMSLWTVDDEATSIMMTTFYSSLTGGTPPGKALRSAQLDVMKENPHPFFWAPFVLFGRS